MVEPALRATGPPQQTAVWWHQLTSALALVLSLLEAGCGGGRARGPQRVPILVARAEQRTVPYEIDATGTVEPIQSAAVTAQAGGLVTRVGFREGDEVPAGTVLFQIDPRPFETAVAEAAAVVARSRAQYETARLDAERAEALGAQQLISADELQRKRGAATALAATVAADSAALASARLNLAYATVRAPVGGKTGSLSIHVGDVVRANDVASPLVTINQIRPIRVRFTASQTDLPEIRRQRGRAPRVEIASAAGDSTWIQGRLTFVDNAVDAASGTLLLKAEFRNRDGVLWPGEFVRVRLRLFEQAGATVVPAAAVSSSQSGAYCYVLKPDTTVEVRAVTVQRTWRDWAVIASGVQPGETVVTDGQMRLSPGARAVIRSAVAADGSSGGGAGGDGRERAERKSGGTGASGR
jgi:membrane fusion protein, multidrug efflux system